MKTYTLQSPETIAKRVVGRMLGGKGSGNYGHSGLDNVWGGSSKGGGGSVLRKQAKKFKTAEEFMKSQSTLYHGTTADFRELEFVSRKKQGSALFQNYIESPKAKVLFFSEDKKNAEFFASWKGEGTPRVIDIKISPDTKIFDFTNISGKNWQKTWDELYKINKKIGEEIDTTNMTMQQAMNDEGFISSLKKAGYDGVRFIEPEGKGTTVGIVNKEVIKTKQQLTDIWKKAQDD